MLCLHMHAMNADQIRNYIAIHYFRPARQKGQEAVTIVAGEVHRALHLSNRVPSVCQALTSKRLQEENGVVLERREGPRSGQSTTMTYTFRFMDGNAVKTPRESSFMQLRGIAKQVFEELGGAEKFLRSERDHFYGPLDERLK